jgi:hypothetical protein
LACIELPPITVTPPGTPPPNWMPPSYGGGFGGGFGGGGGGSAVAASIWLQPGEPHRARCNEGPAERLSHANAAFGMEQARRLATPGLSPIPTGAIVKINFYEGGSERYPVSSAFSTSPFVAPVPGSLNCD